MGAKLVKALIELGLDRAKAGRKELKEVGFRLEFYWRADIIEIKL